MWVGLARAAEDDVNALIDNAIKAKGGADKIAKVKALVMKSKGKYYGMGEKGLDYTEVATFELPDKARVEIQSEAEGMKLAFIEVFDGTKGWNSMNGKTDEMTKDQLAEMKEGMYAHRLGMLYTLKEKGYKITPLPGDVKVGDKAAVGIKVSSEGHRDVNLMFDKKTHLLLKIETQVKDLNDPTVKEPKEVTQELFFDDYKDIDGIPQPRKLVILRAGKKFVEAEITDFKMPEKIDAKMFEKP
jgi:hypothetical protein